MAVWVGVAPLIDRAMGQPPRCTAPTPAGGSLVDPAPPDCTCCDELPAPLPAARFAFVLYGSVSPQSSRRKTDNLFRTGPDLDPSQFVDVAAARNHFEAYLIAPSGGRAAVDVFMHSTVPSSAMRKLLLDLYQPVSARFDNEYNRVWRPRISRIVGGRNASGFATPIVEVSRFISASIALGLMASAEDARGSTYLAVYLTRPDVLLWATVDLRTYCVAEGVVYTNNCHPPYHRLHGKLGCPADFHFVLNSSAARRFATITEHFAEYDFFAESARGFDDSKNRLLSRFLREVVRAKDVRSDHVVAGRHQEVLRKGAQTGKFSYARWCTCNPLHCRHFPLAEVGNATRPRALRRRLSEADGVTVSRPTQPCPGAWRQLRPAPMLNELCRPLDESAVTRMVQRSSGSKRRFFELVGRATHPYNLTQVEWNAPSFELSTRASIAFLGDSMVRELSGAYAAIAPQGEAMYFTESYLGKALDAFRRAPSASCVGDWCGLNKLLHRHAEKPFDALVFGGFQHYTFRHVAYNHDNLTAAPEGLGFDHRVHEETASAAPRKWPTNHRLKAHSPYRNHRLLFESVASALSCLARALSTPIALSGTVHTDATGVLMDPPKFDWDAFHDLALTKIMTAAERDVASKHAAVAEDSDGPLHFLHPSEVSATCPGIRCDGTHFGSFYHTTTAGFECMPTKVAWHQFIADYLLRTGVGCPRSQRNTRPRAQYRGNGEAAGRLQAMKQALAHCLQNYSGW